MLRWVNLPNCTPQNGLTQHQVVQQTLRTEVTHYEHNRHGDMWQVHQLPSREREREREELTIQREGNTILYIFTSLCFCLDVLSYQSILLK